MFWGSILKRVGLLLSLSMGLFLVACANKSGFVQLYPGVPLPASETALIKGHYGYRNGSQANDMLRIVEVDGKRVPKQWGVAEGADSIAVLPRHYEVKVLYVHAYQEVDLYTYKTLEIEARAGCKYQIAAELSMPSRRVMFDVLTSPLLAGNKVDCRADERRQDRLRSDKV